MTLKSKLNTILAGALCLFAFIGCGDSSKPFAVTRNPIGKVDVRTGQSGAFSAALEGTAINRGGAVRTGEKSTTQIAFLDGNTASIRPESYLELNEGDPALKQDSGSILYKIAPQKDSLRIQTPHGVTAVLGTTFLIEVGSQATTVSLEEGKILFTSNSGGEKRELAPGQRLVAPLVGTLPPSIELTVLERESIFNPGGTVEINQR